jgi:putative toxin-antitoxin system antitoxin component (TIGR02293 family)
VFTAAILAVYWRPNGRSNGVDVSAVTVERLLGGRGVLKARPRSSLDWVAIVRGGLPARVLDALATNLKLTRTELAAALGIAERTLARRRKEGVFTAEESAKLLRLARVARRASEVFESGEPALDWLKRPNRALGGERPLSLLDTDIGAENVLDVLGRIEHGVFG